MLYTLGSLICLDKDATCDRHGAHRRRRPGRGAAVRLLFQPLIVQGLEQEKDGASTARERGVSVAGMLWAAFLASRSPPPRSGGGCGPSATGLRSWLCDAEFVLHDLVVQAPC